MSNTFKEGLKVEPKEEPKEKQKENETLEEYMKRIEKLKKQDPANALIGAKMAYWDEHLKNKNSSIEEKTK